jgi:hypothetical protein
MGSPTFNTGIKLEKVKKRYGGTFIEGKSYEPSNYLSSLKETSFYTSRTSKKKLFDFYRNKKLE